MPFSRNIQKKNSFQTPNSKLNIDEPLKAIKVIDFLFFAYVLGLIDIIALKAAAEHDADLTCILFSHNSLHLF